MLRKSNNIYAITLNGLVNPGANLIGTFSIDRNLQEFYLKSVTLNYVLLNNLTGEVINPQNNNVVYLSFVLGLGTVSPIGTPFLNVVNPVGWVNPNDGTLLIVNPGQYIFENFMSRTILPIQWGVLNNDLVNGYTCIVNFSAEVMPY